METGPGWVERCSGKGAGCLGLPAAGTLSPDCGAEVCTLEAEGQGPAAWSFH